MTRLEHYRQAESMVAAYGPAAKQILEDLESGATVKVDQVQAMLAVTQVTMQAAQVHAILATGNWTPA